MPRRRGRQWPMVTKDLDELLIVEGGGTRRPNRREREKGLYIGRTFPSSLFTFPWQPRTSADLQDLRNRLSSAAASELYHCLSLLAGVVTCIRNLFPAV